MDQAQSFEAVREINGGESRNLMNASVLSQTSLVRKENTFLPFMQVFNWSGFEN